MQKIKILLYVLPIFIFSSLIYYFLNLKNKDDFFTPLEFEAGNFETPSGDFNLPAPDMTIPNAPFFSYTPPPISFVSNFSVEICKNPRVGKNCLIEVRGESFEEADTVCAYNYNKNTGEMFVLECKEADIDKRGDVVALYKFQFKESGKHRLIFILSIGGFPLAMQNIYLIVN